MNDIFRLDLDFISIHPIHELLIWMKLVQHLVLFSPIMTLNFSFVNSLFLDKLSLICQASQDHLVSSQMHYRIWENIKYLCEHFSNQRISLFKSDIKRTHETSSKIACNSLILRCQAPAGSMAWRVQFWDDSYSFLHSILYKLASLLGGISFFWRIARILCYLWMRIQYQGERVFIHNVPMQDVELIIHHGINSLKNQMERKVMSGCIDHQTPIDEGRLIPYLDWKV